MGFEVRTANVYEMGDNQADRYGFYARTKKKKYSQDEQQQNVNDVSCFKDKYLLG